MGKLKTNIFQIILIIIIIFISYLILKAIKSIRTINKVLDNGLEVLKKYTNLSEVEIGEYSKITIKKFIPFYTRSYKIKNVGYLAILSCNFGFFQVFSFHLSPYEKDFPILIIDYMQYFGYRNAIYETYNTTLDKDNNIIKNFINEFEKLKKNNSDINDWILSPQWIDQRKMINMRKKGNDSQDEKFISLFSDVIEIYLKNIIKLPKLIGDAKIKKAEKIKEFAEELVEKGGMIGKIFKSKMEEEDVVKLFVDIYFGYKFK